MKHFFAAAFCIFYFTQTVQGFDSGLKGTWQEIRPGGDTTCARGEPFSFFVSLGNSDKVAVDFMGGGACWNAENCSVENSTFEDSIDSLRETYRKGLEGVYNHGDTRNPLKDWTHIIVPYCTGDIHWGNKETVYTKPNGTSFKIQHKGAVNTKAVLQWTKEHYKAPQDVFVLGCSAGAYASIYWTPQIKENYPKANFKQFADSGAGVITDSFFKNTVEMWNAYKDAPTWIPGITPTQQNGKPTSIEDFYTIINHFYPSITTSQFNRAFDGVQIFYYTAMGGAGENWSAKMQASNKLIARKNPNFGYFMAPGEDHCILPYESFYTQKNGDAKFKDWFSSYLNGKNVQNVNCDHCEKED